MSLTIGVPKHSQSRVDKKTWGRLYNNVKKKYKDKCKYCGNTYKFMFCVSNGKVPDKNNSILCCKLCKMVTQCDYSYQKELVLCWSNEPQETIIKKSIKYLENFGKIPNITQIDPNAKKLEVSLIEFVDLLTENAKLPFAMSKYKVFLTPYFNFSYMNLKLDKKNNAMFVDEEDDEDENYNEDFDLACTDEELIEQDEFSEDYAYYLQKIEPDENLPKYELTSIEKNTLTKFFDPSVTFTQNTTLNMDDINDIVRNSIKSHFQDDIEYALSSDEHHGILMDNWIFGKMQ